MMGNIIAKEGNFILTFSAFSSYWKGHVGSQWIRGLRSEVVKLRELILHLWQNIQQIWFPIKKLHHQRKSKPHLWIRVIQILKGPGWLLPAQTSVTLTFFFFLHASCGNSLVSDCQGINYFIKLSAFCHRDPHSLKMMSTYFLFDPLYVKFISLTPKAPEFSWLSLCAINMKQGFENLTLPILRDR